MMELKIECTYSRCRYGFLFLQLVTLKKDPSKVPRKWVQATEFVPVS